MRRQIVPCKSRRWFAKYIPFILETAVEGVPEMVRRARVTAIRDDLVRHGGLLAISTSILGAARTTSLLDIGEL
jgi:hypothetical protein